MYWLLVGTLWCEVSLYGIAQAAMNRLFSPPPRSKEKKEGFGFFNCFTTSAKQMKPSNLCNTKNQRTLNTLQAIKKIEDEEEKLVAVFGKRQRTLEKQKNGYVKLNSVRDMNNKVYKDGQNGVDKHRRFEEIEADIAILKGGRERFRTDVAENCRLGLGEAGGHELVMQRLDSRINQLTVDKDKLLSEIRLQVGNNFTGQKDFASTQEFQELERPATVYKDVQSGVDIRDLIEIKEAEIVRFKEVRERFRTDFAEDYRLGLLQIVGYKEVMHGFDSHINQLIVDRNKLLSELHVQEN